MFKRRKINSGSLQFTSSISKRITSLLSIFLIGISIVFTIDYFSSDSDAKFDFKKYFLEITNSLFLLGGNSNTNLVDNSVLNNKKNLLNGKNQIIETKTNILLVGRGGNGHDAPNLTDSIILLSLNNKFNTITMLSIPRDLYIKFSNGYGGKINQIYALNLDNGEDTAMKELIKHIENITQEKINYYINIDFKGFIDFIDSIGGINIEVPETLVDTQYPNSNWGYKTFIVKKGNFLFDGDTALKYARSRHSTSDFDRSLRQQQIISSIKEKLISGGVLDIIKNANNFYEKSIKYIKTNISIFDIKKLLDLHPHFSDYNVISLNLNDSCYYGSFYCKKGGFLYAPDFTLFGGASILLSDGSNVSNINNYKVLNSFSNFIFNNSNILKEDIKINIFNSTKKSGIALSLAFKLTKYAFNIPSLNSVGNIKDKKYDKTTINYKKDISDSATILYFKKIFFDFEFVSLDNLEYSKDKDISIEIILGDDYNSFLDILNNTFN